MKKVSLLILSFVLSVSSFACPNLTGSYTCDEVDGFGNIFSYNMDITSSGNMYMMSIDGQASETLIADGVTRDFSSDGTSLSMKTFCANNAVVTEVSGSGSADGNQFDFTSESRMEKSGSTLTNTTVVTTFGQSFSTTITCNEY